MSNVPEIMCTLTPGQVFGQEGLVLEMHRAGMASVRLNTAHFDNVEQLGAVARHLKQLCPDLRILIDTKGPEMRTTALSGDTSINLTEGMQISLQGDDTGRPTTSQTIYINFPLIHQYVQVGDTILIDDGHISLNVDDVDGPTIRCHVVNGGELGSRKGISVQGVDVDLPAVSSHDRMFISYAVTCDDIDVIAHSFVRRASDILDVRAVMGANVKPIIAKIENQQGIDNINDILAVADGILIARGDLSASLGKEQIPTAQSLIARATKSAELHLYLATNILPSLMVAAYVSQSDIDGIHTAIKQGVDVMLLTNETASGPRPLQSVHTLRNIIS